MTHRFAVDVQHKSENVIRCLQESNIHTRICETPLCPLKVSSAFCFLLDNAHTLADSLLVPSQHLLQALLLLLRASLCLNARRV